MFENYKARQAIRETEERLELKEREVRLNEQLSGLNESISKQEMVYAKNKLKYATCCAEDAKKFEHDYHSQMEKLGIQIALKQSELKNFTDSLKYAEDLNNDMDKQKDRLIAAKDEEIKRVHELLKLALEKCYAPVEVVQQQNASHKKSKNK